MMELLKKLFASPWLRAAGVRALKTAGQMALLVVLAGGAVSTGGGDEARVISAFLIDWWTVLGAMLGGAFLSAVTSLAGLPELKSDA